MNLASSTVDLVGDSEVNHISIYGFVTEDDLNNNIEKHLDSITEDGEWEKTVQSIVNDHKSHYYHISVESDNGKPLPSFST
jgi:tRNA G37 N-methylase Trm5